MPKLRKIISGGQTGADKTALECAKALGLETGGTAPKLWRTENGADLTLRDDFGLKESQSYDYAARTVQNVKDGDVTLWFGKKGSPGYWCTKNACTKHGKEFYEDLTPLKLVYVVNTFEIVNFAGNRFSKNPDVVPEVQAAFKTIAEAMRPITGPTEEDLEC